MSAEATLYRIHCILQARAAPCYVQPSRTKTARDDEDDDPSDRAKKRQATPQDLQEELAMLRQERDQLSQDKIELEQRNASLEATVNAIENELQNSECSVCQNTLHDPMTLPCGHNYCGACVQTWSEKSQQKDKKYGFMVAACPDCRQEFQPSAIQHNLLFGRIANRFVEAADGQEHTEHANDGVYTGQIFRGRREGRGVLVGKDGSRYEGEFKNGKMHGQGQMIYYTGNQYVGQWKLGKMEGKGVYTWTNGATYDGAWKNDYRHGQGTMTYANGGKYAGQWKQDKQEGSGVYTWADGRAYDGEWENAQRHGHGTMTFSTGDTYTGQWKDGKQEGMGIFTWTNGDTYDGEWKNDQKHGRGVLKKNNGEIYDGKWKYDYILVAVGDRVKVNNYIYWSGMPYIPVNAPDPLRGTVRELEDEDGRLLIKFDDSDTPVRVLEENVTRAHADDPGPPEPGPRDLQVNDIVVVVGTGNEVDGTRAYIDNFDDDGICYIRPDGDDEVESYHVDRLRRVRVPSWGFAVGDRVKLNNYDVISGMRYIDVDAPNPLRGTVIQLEDIHRDLLIKFDDSDTPLRVDGERLTRTDADDPGPPEPGPRDLQRNDRVMVVGTGNERVDGTTGCVEDVDNEQGICDIRPDHDPDEIEIYHIDRLRRTGPAPNTRH